MSTGGSYDPHAVEPGIYRFWEAGGFFHAVPDPAREPYVIDIPLPNVTGSLHMGHALNNTLQDVLIRYKRMCGYNAMWMPGTDHAGIATQAVVEKRLKEEEGLTRHQLGREGLVKRIWEWKEKYGGRILEQLRRLGCSCDWARTRFTLDKVCARAVYEAFFQWFRAGLIYRGLRLVNWDAALQTAVADDEIVHETVRGHLWHYRYPILAADETPRAAGAPDAECKLPDEVARRVLARAVRPDARPGVDYLVIATTRPETMLGDTAVAVHPDDGRYRHLIGRYCLLPLMNRAIPIIADAILVKPEFGTGCVKVTPGHDPNDYAFAQRHDVPMINILTPDGRINANGGHYAGLDRYAARQRVVDDLQALGLMEKVEDYETEIGHSDRSKTPIEPMLSEQWFVKMADLCELAMEAVRDGRVRFFPERYAKTYLDWLGEKRDWCISRQLWWGHRIPVWSRRYNLTESNWPDELLPKGIDSLLEGKWAPEGEIAFRVHRADDGALVADPKREFFPVVPQTEGDYLFYVCYIGGDEKVRRLLADAGFEQDPDVLDTWFSSALWPFSTLGWPDDYGRDPRNKGSGESNDGASIRRSPDASSRLTDLEYFYPTSTLVTAREIITLWVARMVMTGLYFMKDVPFRHVHIHPNIQDGQGRRMSKSAGNGVDPLDLIEAYGADAIRFTLVQMATETQDIRLPVSYQCPHCGGLVPQDSVVPKNKVPAEIQKVTCRHCHRPFATVWAGEALKRELGVARDTSDRFELGRNLCNKLWQAATGFVLPNLEDPGCAVQGADRPRPLRPQDLEVEDRWILSRLSACIEEADRRLANYEFDKLAGAIYGFFWGEFCDWYVELVKPRLYGPQAGRSSDPGPPEPGDEGSAGAGEHSCPEDRRADEPRDSADVARQVLAWVLDQTLRLLHPIMPFVTEALWQRLNAVAPRRGIHELCSVCPAPASGSAGSPPPAPLAGTISPALIVARWPDAGAFRREPDVERDMQALRDVIRALREIRTQVNRIRSAAGQPSLRTLPHAAIRAFGDVADSLRRRLAVIRRLGQCAAAEIGPDATKPPESASKVISVAAAGETAASQIEVYVPLAGLADLSLERQRLSKERDEVGRHIQRLTHKLADGNFVSRAPAELVERERCRLDELRQKLAAIERHLADLT